MPAAQSLISLSALPCLDVYSKTALSRSSVKVQEKVVSGSHGHVWCPCQVLCDTVHLLHLNSTELPFFQKSTSSVVLLMLSSRLFSVQTLRGYWFPPDIKSSLLKIWPMTVSSTYLTAELFPCWRSQWLVYSVNRRWRSTRPSETLTVNTRGEELWLRSAPWGWKQQTALWCRRNDDWGALRWHPERSVDSEGELVGSRLAADFIYQCSAPGSHRSNNAFHLKVSWSWLKQKGDRVFAVTAPQLWNLLPLEIRCVPSVSVCKSLFKATGNLAWNSKNAYMISKLSVS